MAAKMMIHVLARELARSVHQCSSHKPCRRRTQHWYGICRVPVYYSAHHACQCTTHVKDKVQQKLQCLRDIEMLLRHVRTAASPILRHISLDLERSGFDNNVMHAVRSKLGLKLDLSEWAAMLHCVWCGANIHDSTCTWSAVTWAQADC